MKLIFATITFMALLTTTSYAQYEGNEDLDAMESQYTSENVDVYNYNFESSEETSDLPVFDFSEDYSEEVSPETGLAYE